MAAQSPAPAVVTFTTPAAPGFHTAVRIAGDWYALPPFWGARLCGVQNRRAGAALVSPDGHSVRVRLVNPPVEVAA